MHTQIQVPLTASNRFPFLVEIEQPGVRLTGLLNLPHNAQGMVLFVHPDASAHLKPRNQYLVQCLALKGLAVLQTGLLTAPEERRHDDRFLDAPDFFTGRVVNAALWTRR